MSADQRIVSERVDYAGQAYRIRSEARPEPGEIVTTLERGDDVLMSKSAPYNATLDPDAVDRVLGVENRRVRERLLAGDLDAWLSVVEPTAEPDPPVAAAAVARRQPLRRPGRWAVKVGMVEKPFRSETPVASPAEAQAWESAPAPSASPKPPPAPEPASLPRHLGPYCLVEAAGADRFLAVGGGGAAERLVVLRTFARASSELTGDARSLLRIEHAALVPVLEVGMADEVLFVATALPDGRDAAAMLRRAGELGRPLPLDVVAWMVREIARAVQILHGAQRAHGAIAPDVVQVGWGGELRLGGLAESLGRKEQPQVGDDIAALGTLLLALLGRGPGDGAQSGNRAPFVPPALLQIATRSAREGAGPQPLRSAQAVESALTTYLVHDAPRTDAPRVARILAELFADGAKDDAARKAELLERARQLPRPTAEPAPPDAGTTPPIASVGARANDVERPPGSIVDGRYRLNRLCGRGGMGWVYDAEHQGIGKRVALKILHPFYSRSSDISERFRREARAASKIGHPHIADVFDFGTTEDGCLYIAMEFLEGEDLGNVLDEGPLPIDRALRITEQVCRALDAAHSAGVVHRDLKPENVFLIQNDFVKVLDFGIAKYVEDPKEEKLTRPNIALGTPEYMAPEQVAGKVEPRSDIYAVGAMLYEMLVGSPPFEGENYLEVFRRKALEDPIAPSTLRDGIVPEVDALILRSLARKPEGRPASMAALADEIAALLTSTR